MSETKEDDLKQGDSGIENEEQKDQFAGRRVEASIFRSGLSNEKIQREKKVILVRCSKKDRAKLDFTELRGKLVLITSARLAVLDENNALCDTTCQTHAKELNELMETFGHENIHCIVLVCHESKIEPSELKGQERIKAQKIVRQVSLKMNLDFRLSVPTQVDGGNTHNLVKCLKKQSNSESNIGGDFRSYFLLDQTGVLIGRFDNVFPKQLEPQIRSLVV